MLTPGIDFLLRALTKITLPPLFISLLARTLATYHHHPCPTWILVSASILSVPLISATRIVSTRLYHRHQAAKLGARLAPEVQGRWFGNFDVLNRLMHVFDVGYPAEGILDLHSKFGPVFNVRMGWSDLIFTTSPDYIKRILATEFNNFVKGQRFHDTMFSALGSGVFNSDGDMWKFHRSMTRPFFTRDRISDFDIFDEHSDIAIRLMRERLQAGHPVDFQDVMSRFTLDSASFFLFGNSVGSLECGLPYPHNVSPTPPVVDSATKGSQANAFAHAFLTAQEIISTRERYGWIWPLSEITVDKTKEPMRVVRAYLDPIIKEAVAKQGVSEATAAGKKKADEVGEGETLLDHLVSLTSDPVVIRDETMNIMIAGRDTTAATLTFLVYLLAMHPTVVQRLREEILEKVGSTRRPDYDDIRDMKYLRAVINETLRLFPIVPLNTRESINATVWPSPDPSQPPIYIPARTKTVYSVFLMQRRQDLWGPDAEEFDPDRFLDDRMKTYLVKNSFIFLPFNAGPRICLGQQFAYNEMSFMVIRLLQQFSSIALDLDACPPDARPKPEWKDGEGRKAVERVYPKIHLTMYAAGGLWVNMQEAEVRG